MFIFLFYSFTVIALLVGMITTFRKPKIHKYNTLIGSEIFSVALCIIRCICINQENSRNALGEVISIMMVFPLYVIMLIVTVIVCLSTRHRWCFRDDPGFCS